MEPLWIGLAFVLGFVVRQVGLPALVGFLAAGFLLPLPPFNATYSEELQQVADFGVTLMLFTIGLKLDLRTLAKPVIWGPAVLHMVAVVGLFTLLLQALGAAGVPLLAELHWGSAAMVAFALSFSSTVFAVVIFQQKGELAALHAAVAIGVLIMQDIAAVLFMTVSKGAWPSPWALCLLALVPLRPVLGMLLARCGHGELQVMFGLLTPIAAYVLFESLGVKGDLGALLLGVLLAHHPMAGELARTLFGFKEIFLVTFFLTIGMRAELDGTKVLVAALLLTWIPLKMGLFQLLFSFFRLRARTALIATLGLSNYSEFGLIVASLGISMGIITADWLVVMALALAASYVLAAPVNMQSLRLYRWWSSFLHRWERPQRLPEEAPVDLGSARVLIFGLGRVGNATYDEMRIHYGAAVKGLDSDPGVVKELRASGRNIDLGDPTDRDLWDRLDLSQIRLVMLTTSSLAANLAAIKELRSQQFDGLVTAVARYDDQVDELLAHGADAAYNVMGEAGFAFAEHVCDQVGLALGEDRTASEEVSPQHQ